jgi:hypothetical protein
MKKMNSNSMQIRTGRKMFLLMVVLFMALNVCKAQYYNTTTTYKNSYGQTTGTAQSSTDYYGNTTTTYKDEYGRVTGTAKKY